MIVTHRPKKRPKVVKAKAATVIGMGIVAAKPPRRRRYETPEDLPPDPEADARVAAFFARMIRPR